MARKTQSVILHGNRIVLRLPSLSEADAVFRLAKHPAIARYTTLPQPYLREHATGFIKKLHKTPRNATRCQLGIFDKTTGQFIGMIGIHKIDPISKNGELGYWLGKPFWGKGYASEAVTTMLAHAFKSLKLKRVYAKVYHKNPASAHILEKHGFVREGTLRKHVFRNNQWYDEHYYGLLQTEHLVRNRRVKARTSK